ncbi:MAG: hypothetical protein EZS28_043015 [Streblomastix strix]|uniref:HNH nuclease domain-containing protein n=1 Tax=Streblomastix strix TaxID=222440 RepID=A0A5J4TTC2_9EUKA|nr:MAG: hypothetical protein EZS28_043015 [Streblomastix strix]
MGSFIHSTELNDDLYAVQVDRENCRCNTCLQVAYIVLDSAKFWMHFVQGDMDSLTWAISGNVNRGPDQLFEEVIKDQEFYDTYKDCVYTDNGQKQILHIGVEKQGYNCIALSPKNYIINDEIVLKGVILDQNPQINEQTFMDCVNKGTIATAINKTLAQRKGAMSRLKMSKNAITGSHTKMIVLSNQSQMTTEANEGQFVPLVADTDFEINDTFPHQIRRISDQRIMKPSIKEGFYTIQLNEKNYYLHRLIAQNFIPNPNNLPQIDHINRDKSDYHIENLRWITASDNCKNKTSTHNIDYVYVDSLSDEAIVVNNYGKHHFEFYYYDPETDEFLFYNGRQYRQLHVNEVKKTGFLYVIMIDEDDKRVNVYLNKFKKIYEIEF